MRSVWAQQDYKSLSMSVCLSVYHNTVVNFQLILKIICGTMQYTENLYSAAIRKCPGALTILKYIKTEIKSISDECTLEQKCLELFLEYVSCLVLFGHI